MSLIDWCILISTLLGVVIYGLWKSRGQHGADTFIRAGKQMPWQMVLLGIMATQASAITFISGPGQAYSDGMRFIQYYFGLPLAMIVISAVFVPIFRKMNVYTAYEYLDKRFDRKTRLFTGILFLFSRGVATGISIYAPAIVLSSIFGWNIYLANISIGGVLIIYSYTGGAQAIAHTQKLQFLIILAAMAFAGFLVVHLLPDGIGFGDALYIAGKTGKLNVITTNFDINDKYNIWSGVIGGFFLALSYFGTDQSQVGRYISGKNLKQSKLGLLMNGMVKIPMQFGILLIGALLFAFFTINKGPLFFNESAAEKVAKVAPKAYEPLYIEHQLVVNNNQKTALDLLALRGKEGRQTEEKRAYLIQTLKNGGQAIKNQKKEMQTLIKDNSASIGEPDNDVNYVFLYFVKHYLPIGAVGLVFAIIFLASWSSISAAVNALASSSLIDFHQVIARRPLSQRQQLHFGRIYTLIWGGFGIVVASFATKLGSLIEAVNELGSLFYGTILGIFLIAFFSKRIKGTAVFYAALVAEIAILFFYYFKLVSFLWLNLLGALFVIVLAVAIESMKQFGQKTLKENDNN